MRKGGRDVFLTFIIFKIFHFRIFEKNREREREKAKVRERHLPTSERQ